MPRRGYRGGGRGGSSSSRGMQAEPEPEPYTAKHEFLNHVDEAKVKACWIVIEPSHRFGSDLEPLFKRKHINLPVNYTPEQYEEFLREIDVEYDNGYGGQELWGEIWYDDGTWSERAEYDGSEWWKHCSAPAIADDLLDYPPGKPLAETKPLGSKRGETPAMDEIDEEDVDVLVAAAVMHPHGC